MTLTVCMVSNVVMAQATINPPSFANLHGSWWSASWDVSEDLDKYWLSQRLMSLDRHTELL